MTNDVSIKKLILVPAVITLAVTLLRLTAELRHWSATLLNPAAGGAIAKWLMIGLLPQLTIWIWFTIAVGTLFGALGVAATGRARRPATA
jgi:hypothetical protein